MIAPEFYTVPSFKSTLDFREKLFVRMTNEQNNIVNFLEEQRSAAIHGAAGTGKTVWL